MRHPLHLGNELTTHTTLGLALRKSFWEVLGYLIWPQRFTWCHTYHEPPELSKPLSVQVLIPSSPSLHVRPDG